MKDERCPFCGSNDSTTGGDQYGCYFVYCRNCQARGPEVKSPDYDKIWELWLCKKLNQQ